MVVKNSVTDDIQEYDFTTLDDSKLETKDGVKDYKIKNIDLDTSILQNQIRIERKLAKEKNFNISSIVRSHRGIVSQEEDDRRKEIERTIEERINSIKKEALQKGYEDGFKIGKDEAISKMRESSSDKLEKLTEILTVLVKEKERLLQQEKIEVYHLIKNLTKWIILRELKDDGDYVKRLLEKLITEIGQSQSILVQMSQEQFQHMPEVKKVIKENMEAVKNVRVEVDYDIHDKGLVIETKNFIIKGTLEEQLQSFDKLFESVGPIYDERRTDS